MPSAPGKTIREIVAICERAGVRARIIPGIAELVDGRFSVNHIRDVQIEDLLRRAPIQTDMQAVGRLIRGRRVLVTGGGGSIGSEICRHVLRYEPSDLIILGHGENSVFAIHNELYRWLNTPRGESDSVDGDGQCRSYRTPTLHTVIADIRFSERIHAVFERYRPEIVFHAAAHKHVPLMEANPVEAATNNVLGTRNLLDAAIVTGVERFVMISTDKAVNPTSITSGSSKRAAELLVHHAAKVSSAFRQRPGQSRQCRVDVQTADCRRWTGDSNPSGDAPLFHDHPRSGATGVAGGGAWSGRRGVYAGHG